jgi:hypothetical protein
MSNSDIEHQDPTSSSNDNSKAVSLTEEKSNTISFEDSFKDPLYYTKNIQPTDNTLSDMSNCLKLGDVVVLHIEGDMTNFYHKCDKSITDAEKYLSTRRVVYLDVADNPGLADKDDGWEYYLCEDGVVPCECSVKNFIKQKNKPSYSQSFGLGFRMPVVIFNKEYIARKIIDNVK